MYGFLGTLLVHSSWISRILDAQTEDSWIQPHKGEIIQETDSDWTIGIDGGLRMKGGLVIPDIPQLKELIDEAHLLSTRYIQAPQRCART